MSVRTENDHAGSLPPLRTSGLETCDCWALGMRWSESQVPRSISLTRRVSGRSGATPLAGRSAAGPRVPLTLHPEMRGRLSPARHPSKRRISSSLVRSRAILSYRASDVAVISTPLRSALYAASLTDSDSSLNSPMNWEMKLG